MSATPKYTHVLDACGTPTRQWDSIRNILTSLTAHTRRMRDDKEAIGSWVEVEIWKQLLPGMFKVCLPNGSALNAYETASIVTQAVSEVALSTNPDALPDFRVLLTKCDSAIARILKEGTRRFALYTKVALPCDTSSPVVSGIMTLEHAEERDTRKWVPSALRDPIRHEHLNEWQACTLPLFKITTTAHSEHQAVEEALRFLSVCRALVSLRRAGRNRSVQLMGRRKSPLAPVPLGPSHFLCDANDEDIADAMWIEDVPHNDYGKAEILKEQWAAVACRLSEDLARLERLSYRPAMESLLCMYTNALDQRLWPVALLQLWNVLEQIAGNCRQEDIARRVAGLCANPAHIRELVTIVRCTRNRFVHAGHADAVNEQWAMVIQPLVEHHLTQLLMNTLGIDEITEYGERLMAVGEQKGVSQ